MASHSDFIAHSHKILDFHPNGCDATRMKGVNLVQPAEMRNVIERCLDAEHQLFSREGIPACG